MGTWSFHPMGNDDALNARDEFLHVLLPKEMESIFDDDELVKNTLLHLTPDQIDAAIRENNFWFKPQSFGDKSDVYRNRYSYVVPYTFIDWKAFDISN